MSNQNKFTPGPWIIETYHGSMFKICKPDFKLGDEVAPRLEADARLIAAAPDLLDVVQLIIKEWEKPTEGVQVGELIARLSQYSVEARAAIEKATGGTK